MLETPDLSPGLAARLSKFGAIRFAHYGGPWPDLRTAHGEFILVVRAIPDAELLAQISRADRQGVDIVLLAKADVCSDWYAEVAASADAILFLRNAHTLLAYWGAREEDLERVFPPEIATPGYAAGEWQ